MKHVLSSATVASTLLASIAAQATYGSTTLSTTSKPATSTGIASISSAATTSSSSTVPTIDISQPVNSTLTATAWALIYTYPLYIFGNFAGNVFRNGYTVNQIFHQRALASPDASAVIKPNIDTVYSRAVLDLSSHDLVLTVPNISDGRYWVYPVIDSFGNIIAEIGKLDNNSPGQYLIRRSDDSLSPPGIKLARDFADVQSPYEGIVDIPTTYGTSLMRLFVKANTTADLDQIHGYQNATSIQEVHRSITRAASPAGNISSLAPNGSLLDINSSQKLFDFAAKFTPYNQPENYTDRARVAGILGAAGVYDGAYHIPAGLNLTQAEVIANASISADINEPSHIRDLGNGWEIPIVSYQGNYGLNYAPRAYVAIYGYQQQTVAQTLYPGYKNIGFTSNFDLAQDQSVLFSFSEKPKLKTSGFWSLSIYGADQYLIRNPLNRFEIGDRSYNVTYRGSTDTVYGASASNLTDGPFDILIQNVNATPPANWTGNWLPGAQSFSVILRWYAPEDAQTNGSYIYPRVSTIEQIK